MKLSKSKRLNHYIKLACLTGALFCYSASAYAEVMPNTQLPENPLWTYGGVDFKKPGNNTMNITQDGENAIIKWDKFSIGSIATVNFDSKAGGAFNVLNYDAGGSMSQIRGTLKSTAGGNIFIVNPAGVFIGNSAQVDVGSLYVSNRKLDDSALQGFGTKTTTINDLFNSAQPASSAELMSLGHINANNVTFVGDRIVLDTELLTTNGLENKMAAEAIQITTSAPNKVVIGYNEYDAGDKYNQTEVQKQEVIAKVNGNDFTKADGYMWVRDLEQLQAMNTNKSGNYALRNGIGAISTVDNSFTPIGDSAKPFTGKLDGLAGNVDGIDFAIFDLNVKGNSNLGLFGVTDGAEIRNVLLTGGSITGTGNDIGALVGLARNTTIENVRNSINVTGGNNVGGIVGKVEDINGKSATTISDILNTGNVDGSSNVGGIVGSIAGTNNNHAEINDAENIGRVQGVDKESITTPENDYSHNIGGIAGSAQYADISKVENNLKVEGGYNVGGIVGNGANVTIKGAVNNADVTATGYTEGTYKYKTEVGGKRDKNLKVNVANVGGIAGSISGNSQLDTITNEGGDIFTKFTSSETYGKYYHAGNVGGIVGSAVGSGTGNVVTITNAENKENTIFGAHNVGGIAGYLENGKITLSSNNGGEITGTGARTSESDSTDANSIKDYENNFAYESIRYRNNESFLIGNMGGIVGYMYGDNAFVSQSGNRGNVHSQKFDTSKDAPLTAKAANVGGIVGKINRNDQNTLEEISRDEKLATVYDSYNRGNVQGYTGVGGVIGLMYNGAVAASDNSGTVMATRASSIGSSVEALNMGGIVGDTTEEGSARAIIYDVHNDGVIGSSVLTDFYGRHVGGVVGRLSGEVEKTYNTGAIYNGYNVVGGIAGYMAAGKINNSFNTGNITVYNQNDATSQVGGIVGGVDAYYQIEISNAYNLGTLRSFKGTNNGAGDNTVGGIVGGIVNWTTEQNESVTISNVYTLGNLYSYANNRSETDNMGAIVGSFRDVGINPTISNAYYIKPEVTVTSGDNGFRTLSGDNLNNAIPIDFNNRGNIDSYKNDTKGWKFDFSNNGLDGTDIDVNTPWRIYNYTAPDGSKILTTPILNAFLPKAEDYFDNVDAVSENRKNIASTQYGTAYNPLLTIINAKTPDADATDITNDMYTIEFDWNQINPDRSASFAVFNGNLSINDFDTNGRLYGGTLYAKGALSINNVYSETQDNNGKTYVNSGDVLLGSGAKLYGSTINVTSGEEEDGTLTNGGKLVNYGTIRSTGQVGTNSSITLRAEGDVEIIGEITSNGEENVVVPNIGRYPTDTENGDLKQQIIANIANKDEAMPDVGEYYSRRFTAESKSGDITITSQNGDVDVLLGVAGKGYINSSKNLTIAGKNVYVDSDLSISKNFALNAAEDTVLDITNIGAVTSPNAQETAREEFVKHFKTTTENDTNSNTISFSNVADAMITMDLWNGNSFELASHTDLGNALRALKVEGVEKGFDLFHIWIDDAAALQGIHNDIGRYGAGENALDILTYNFALKNDIDAAELTGGKFTAIGADVDGDSNVDSTKVFTGKFNGRDNTIVGLDVDNDSAGLFSVIGTAIVDEKEQVGEVSNLNIYSSSFKGGTVGAVAGINKGTIDNVTTFGNRVNSDKTVNADQIAGTNPGVSGSISSAGGIAGINNGTISNANVNDAVATTVAKTGTGTSYAGGIAGVNTATGNNQAKIDNSVANSDVTSTEGAHALGGIVAINSGNAVLDTVRNLGIVNGTYSVGGNIISDNVGGIAGINKDGAQITKAYNVAQVSGGENVGGIVGNGTTGNLQEVVSAGDIISSGTNAQNVGGIIGKSDAMVINSGRNTGEVTGKENVGGIVGVNGSRSQMNNIINDANATIKGENNVGGLAGTNAGKIAASDMGLVNDGRVYGQTNVGGVVGVNEAGGLINNTNSNITLYVANENIDAKYFGGVAGRNEGTITSATNTGSVLAENASYVGGIVGVNGTLVVDASGNPDLDANGNEKFEAGNSAITGAGNSNSGKVVGAKYVGGVAGLNVGQVVGTAHDDVVEIQNQGTVIATNNGAGGIFGENRADISEAVLKNSGTVIGSTLDGTGGIIGLNSGNISNSDLINTVDGLVVGMKNVGGLIGINKGTIKGGNNGSYYAHQVYNNGTVIGGNGTDVKPADNDLVKWKSKTITDADGNESTIWYQTNTNSHDIGGLIGSNVVDNNKTGSLTAGYNTGIVEGGTNVGGVVGNNAGTVDQVFNAGAVTGTAENKVVGTVVGNNAGTVTNAYDMAMTDNTTGAIGGGNSMNVDNTTDANDSNVWKTYGDKSDYGANKLLSVFLTKINFVPEYENAFKDFVYNAHLQNIIVKAVENGTDDNGNKLYVVNVYKNDGVTKEADGKDKLTLLGHFVNASNNLPNDANAAHSLADFVNSKLTIDDTNVLLKGNTLTTTGGDGVTDAGTYRIFNTQQINVVEGNHNNLGFDITDINVDSDGQPGKIDDVDVKKAQISLTLDDVYRIYGDAAIDNKTVAVFNHIFGDKGNKDYGFTINGNNVTMNQKLVDELMNGVLKHSIKADGAVDNLAEGKTTNDVDTYDWSLQAILDNNNNNLSANYELVGDNGGVYTGIGKSHVDKAELTITVDDKSIQVGEEEPAYTGKFNGLTNGDTEETLKLGYDLDGDFDSSAKKVYEDKIGVLIGNNGGVYLDKNSIENILKNYKVTIDPGTLTVTGSGTKPDPDPGPGPDNPHNWQAEDKYPWYQWDKQRHERERKAEVHFVDGGMRVEA